MNYSRQQEAFEVQSFRTPVHVIGAGATGSWVVLMLAKMGIQDIHVWDFDTVEEHNIPNQFFSVADAKKEVMFNGELLSKTKVNRLANNIELFTGITITAHNERVDGSQRLNGIVFMLTDTMSSRKEIWEKAIKLKVGVKLLIETRMDLKGGFIYNINPTSPSQIREYEKTLYSDAESAVSACGTSQSLIATAMEISTKAVWQLINWHNSVPLPNVISIASEHNVILADNWE